MDLKQVLPLVALFCCFSAVLVASSIRVATAATPESSDVHVPAMYVFGDSLADVGNNYFLPGSKAVANFSPYGVDSPGGVPVGRFCNGYIFVDFLAMKMGFKQSPPPALGLINGGDRVPPLALDVQGLNFASGGSGILDSTGVNDSISLTTQVNLFAKVVASLVAAKGKPAADADLSRSPVIFSAGTNDLASWYLRGAFSSSANSSRNSSSLQVFVSSLVAAYRDQLQRIYNLGARKFVFIAVYMGGCAPGFRAVTASGSCVDGFNAMAQMFNDALRDMLGQGLANSGDEQRFPKDGFEYSITNAYELFSTIIANPLPYGITEVTRACCGHSTGDCLPNTTDFCSDRPQYLFWDASHPSEAGAKLIADYGFSGQPKFAYPINIAQLLHLH